MAKIKYYAVRKGIKPGIYTSWPDCEAQVKGVNGAEYKSFSTEEEADEYMLDEPDTKRDNNNDIDSINEKIESCISNLLDEEILAFVDGSYNNAEKKGGYGVVILSSDGSKEKLYRSITEEYDQDFIELWNIAPEIEATKQAINWAVKNNKRKITVFHNYEGIGRWADGDWKAKKPLTKKYVRFIENIRKQIEVIFIRVPAHSVVPLNEEADQLAKRSLLEKGYKNYDDGSVYFVGLSTDDWKSVADLINEENSELEEKTADIVLSEEVINNHRTKLIMKQAGNRITINCYTGDRSYVQGRHSALLQRIIATAIGLMKTGESVVETYNSYHALDLEREDVEVKFDLLLPNYRGDRNGKHYANLMTAVYNTMLTGYRPDYTHLIMPVFRSYEYYLHRILCDELGLTTTNNGINNFKYFDKNANGRYECNNSAKDVLNQEQLDYLNDLYNNYNRVRHPYSHWAYEDVDCSVITDMTEARNLLEQGLSLFNSYYLLY